MILSSWKFVFLMEYAKIEQAKEKLCLQKKLKQGSLY